MKVIVHRGSKQVGGCITEIQSQNGTKIIIDVGENLPSKSREIKPELKIEGLNYGKPAYDAVFVTHYHGDHIGLYNQILPEIPIYIGEISKEIYKILQRKLLKSKIVSESDIALVDRFKTFKIPEKIKIKDITITPIACDHSAFDAHMFLIECDGKKLLHTGDFRTHGQRGKAVIPALTKYVGQVDCLVCEGTTLSRNNEDVVSEFDLQLKAEKVFKENKFNFVLCSSTNIDRIAGIHKAALKANRLFVCDEYQKELLMFIDSVSRSGLYKFKNKVYSFAHNLLPIMRDKGFVMLVRPNWISKQVMKMFPDASFVYSQWEGYLAEDFKEYDYLQDFVPDDYLYLHTTGHADFDSLKQVCLLLNPKLLVPIHSENPSAFLDMQIPNCKVVLAEDETEGEAKKEYQRNIVKGNSAYMMEQETDNIFKISVGKINRDEEVTVKIQYIDKFEIIDNTIQILMPTLVTPRYKSNITSKLVYGKVDYTIDFNININKTINRKSISSSSHKINVIDEDKTERVEVLNYDLSKDFKLNIELKNELSSNAITSKTRDGKDMIYLSFMPEILDSYEDSEKEYLFIIDVSGSMMGEKLDETKRAVIECLKQLDTGDKFNIIPFESEFEAMNIKSIEYNEENMKKAIKYINNLEPLGGTEILDPIKFALYEKDSDKIILLFTDGQVGNEEEIIKFVNNNINRSRIFPFGIDTNVNSSFIKQLAKASNGKAELILPKEKIDDKIIRTFARIQTPLLEEIKIDYGNNKVLDEIREEKCLFNYEFFNIFAKIEKLEDDIQLKGKILDKEYIWKINKDNIYSTEVDLGVLFAKQEMERLEEYIRNTYENEKIENYKKMIIELSEKYNINSKYTSFITVYEREDKLLEVPKYQETKLSNKFAEGAMLNKVWEMFDMDECLAGYEEEVQCYDMSEPSFLRKNSSISSGDLDIPSFKSRKKIINFESKSAEIKKTNGEILAEKVDEYYKVFISQDEKSILTFLLYALYYLRKRNNLFNYNDLLRFLGKHKDELLKSELCLRLLCLCYKQLENNRVLDKKETLELMDDDFRKVAVTNLKINVNLKTITEEEVQNLIINDKVLDNLDDVIWYLINYSYWRPWLI